MRERKREKARNINISLWTGRLIYLLVIGRRVRYMLVSGMVKSMRVKSKVDQLTTKWVLINHFIYYWRTGWSGVDDPLICQSSGG